MGNETQHLSLLRQALGENPVPSSFVSEAEAPGSHRKVLFQRERLPVSGDLVSEARVRRQIRQGSGAMPPHPQLSEPDVSARWRT